MYIHAHVCMYVCVYTNVFFILAHLASILLVCILSIAQCLDSNGLPTRAGYTYMHMHTCTCIHVCMYMCVFLYWPGLTLFCVKNS